MIAPRRSVLVWAAVAAAAAACAPTAPAAPSFQADVLPILAANCVRCHAVPAIGGAPGDLRLDSYDDTLVDERDPADPGDDVIVRGAASVAAILPARLDDPRDPMPPRFPLGEPERELVIAWAQGEPPDRTPRPDNRLPAIAVVAERTGTIVTLVYDLADADRDLVQGHLRARGAVDRLIAPIAAGRDTLRWDTAGIPAGTYALVARVDDGAGWHELAAGTIELGAPP